MTVEWDWLNEEITAWQEETFPNATAASVTEHLRREANELHAHYFDAEQELCGHVDVYTPVVGHHGTTLDIAEEAADLYFMLRALEKQEGFDLKAAVEAKLKKNKARTWKEPDAFGVVEHEEG